MPTLEAKLPFRITKPIITKLLSIIDAGLISGGGNRPEPGKICVEQAVCLALDLPHSDDPLCVSRALRQVKMSLNDSNWSSNTARANGLRKLAIAQLGTRDVLDDVEFTKKLAELTIRKMVPRALRIIAALPAVKSHSEKLEAAAVTCEQQGTIDAASAASDAARAVSDAARAVSDAARAASYAASAASYAVSAARAVSDAASYAVSDAVSDAASYAVSAASYAVSAASYAARAASYAARAASYAVSAASYAVSAASYAVSAASYAASYAVSDAASYAVSDAASYAVSDAASYAVSDAASYAVSARDAELTFFADLVLEVLIALKMPGVKWLKYVKQPELTSAI